MASKSFCPFVAPAGPRQLQSLCLQTNLLQMPAMLGAVESPLVPSLSDQKKPSMAKKPALVSTLPLYSHQKYASRASALRVHLSNASLFSLAFSSSSASLFGSRLLRKFYRWSRWVLFTRAAAPCFSGPFHQRHHLPRPEPPSSSCCQQASVLNESLHSRIWIILFISDASRPWAVKTFAMAAMSLVCKSCSAATIRARRKPVTCSAPTVASKSTKTAGMK